ncbi:type II secretion system F family protein [Candidatus Bathyarchaeota archaeon]|nr:type II secretion system F family protein [Candidatus Bathyarchaeota archaeon]
MKENKAVKKLKAFILRLQAKLKLSLPKSLKLKKELKEDNPTLAEPHSVAYQLIGEKTERVLPLFRDLAPGLYRSGLKINIRVYVSLALLAAIIATFTSLLLTPCITYFFLHIPLLSSVLFGVGGSLFAFAFSIIGFYVYPLYRADKLRRELEDELPFTTGYMAILASAGVSPEKTFYSLSNLSVPLAISEEARNIVRDVNLFGKDIISALNESSKRTPSERLHEMLEGFISTIHSGGNLAGYLRVKSDQYMKLKRMSLRKFSDTLSILSEFYVAILVTGPLLLVIMLAVMAMLGGGGLGILSPDLILNLLTYIGIPLGSIMFLIILDSVSPKW